MPDVFDLSSDESAGETGSLSDPGLPAARLKRPRKRGPRNEYRAWICKSVLDCDLFYAESTNGLTVEEKTKNKLQLHGYRLFQGRYRVFTAGSHEPDAYKIIKIMLRTGEVKAGGDNQLPDKLTIFDTSFGPLVICY